LQTGLQSKSRGFEIRHNGLLQYKNHRRQFMAGFISPSPAS
jgi:hypothetical protein